MDNTWAERIEKWIVEKKQNGNDWDQIENLCVEDDQVESRFKELKFREMAVPRNMTLEEWKKAVKEVKEKYIPIKTISINGVYASSDLFEEYPIPNGSFDAWRRYEKLLRGEIDDIRRMEDTSISHIRSDSHWILNRLRKETRECGPRRGLVMGSVQEGKTANMLGLVSMAAHYDWNLFIVLSGTIENLRKQTEGRFISDLIYCQDANWHFLESCTEEDFLYDVKEDRKITLRELRLNYSEPSTINRSPYHDTYVIVCLKQATRLRKLVSWLNSEKNYASRMRMVIIDDEADQASINTAQMTGEEVKNRTEINRLVTSLANGKDGTGQKVKFQAINYLSYTATPYANVLNEAGKDSLYPKDYIISLHENNSYFGGKVIFGSKRDEKYPGMDIIRAINKDDGQTIAKIGKGGGQVLPDSFMDSVAWFLCCVAVFRVRGIVKPVSMLIHTSARNDAHFFLYTSLRNRFISDRKNGKLIKRCEEVYLRETKRFTYASFAESYSLYEGLQSMDKEYPDFSLLKSELDIILSEDPKTIEVASNKELIYSEKGIHFCVDNYQAPRYGDGDGQLRIIYPKKEILKSMEKAPAFIVVGGNTLSRGLTIEGLVSTFFTRTSNQADSLMQMARWYGYRKGYELLPRIWMTNEAIQKYKLLQEIDEKLKKTLEEFKEMGRSPSEYAPAVMNTSSIARFLITAKNKSQGMIPCKLNYSSDSYEVTELPLSDETIKQNLLLSEKFLCDIGTPEKSKIYPERSYIWRLVPSERIIEYIKSFKVFAPSSFADQMSSFIPWMEKENGAGHYLKWNVAVCGSSIYKREKWKINDGLPLLGKVERTKRSCVSSHIDFGSLRSGRDGICDFENIPEDASGLDDGKKGKNIELLRGKFGYSDIPLLLIYCISKDGGEDSQTKSKLRTEKEGIAYDVIAYSIIIGGDSFNADHVESVMVNIPVEEDEDEANE
jgi:hypothetical protein